jgi:hypothetical protein
MLRLPRGVEGIEHDLERVGNGAADDGSLNAALGSARGLDCESMLTEKLEKCRM